MTRLVRLTAILALSVALSGCAEAVLAGLSVGASFLGIGQRMIDYRIQQEKTERLKALEEQLKIQNERLFKLCEQVKRQGKPGEGDC